MKINEATVGRKFNLGNYESLEIRVSVSPEPGDEQKQFEESLEELTTKLNTKIKEMGVKLK